ncbi:family 43 glycosylhydrolase [Micromonospora sp. M12]
MDFTLDDVSVVGAAPPAPASKTIEVVGKLPGEHNPLIGHKFGADGFGLVHDGRVYMYMTNDTRATPRTPPPASPGINYGDINQITVISSEDLVNWTDHGEIQVAGPNGVAPFTANSWAPGITKKVVNGVEKFFLYYANGGGSSNVITGASPLGPWTSERTSTLIDGRTPVPRTSRGSSTRPRSWTTTASRTSTSVVVPRRRACRRPSASTTRRTSGRSNSTTPWSLPRERPRWSMPRSPSRRVTSSSARVSTTSRTPRTSVGTTSAVASSRFPVTPGWPDRLHDLRRSDVVAEGDLRGCALPEPVTVLRRRHRWQQPPVGVRVRRKYYFTYHAPTLNKRINGNTTQGTAARTSRS